MRTRNGDKVTFDQVGARVRTPEVVMQSELLPRFSLTQLMSLTAVVALVSIGFRSGNGVTGSQLGFITVARAMMAIVALSVTLFLLGWLADQVVSHATGRRSSNGEPE